MSAEIRQQVTDRILKALAEGLVPWGRPWLGHRNDGPPTNTLTSLPFRGVNPLLLNLAVFKSKWWATERVWTVFGYRLKPHQQGTQVYHGELGDLQSETVFNAEQVDGPGVERYLLGGTTGMRQPDYEAAERVIAATGADIRHVPGTQAVYYRLPKDYIVLPLKAQFESGPGGLPAYYSTALHELIHWSEHRLRWLADPHLSIKERYRIGELRATWGSAVLCAEIGIPFYHGQKGHAMCVGTWMQLMGADNTFVFRLAEAIGKAAQFILSFRRHYQVVASGVINGLPRLNR
jgi:antirestriction protein ArdC